MLACLCAVVNLGCRINTEVGARRAARLASFAQQDTVHVDPVRQRSRWGPFATVLARAPQPSDRTQQLLRRYNLADRYEHHPQDVIRWMKEICHDSPSMEEVHALAEIALIQANWARQKRDAETATELYATAIVHAYQFLFDPQLDLRRNAYDPQFRSICDVYNQSLEGLLRIVCGSDRLRVGMRHVVGEGDMAFEFSVQIEGRWKDEKFERFELTNDFEMQGIENLYHTYGLGVPLIAVHDASDTRDPTAKYYPPGLTLPLTAFCEVLPAEKGGQSSDRRQAVLRLYDPLEQTSFHLAGRHVPLESDITTPLAYHMDDPLLNTGVLATASMINARVAQQLYGLYMLEPFDPDKIPVVMVHGLWSSPTTWIEMFNDLRASRDLRGNYQFWFYAYPTGQPFWYSARDMRRDLATARAVLDPEGNSPSLNQMVLVGHSMGGLVSRLQTLASDDLFWRIISDEEIENFAGDRETLQSLKETFYFDPNPSIKRVITLATPHRGSRLANNATKWISQKLFTLPDTLTRDFKDLARENESRLQNGAMLTTTTSVDSLSPDSPFFEAMAAADASSTVTFHNVMGNLPAKNFSLFGTQKSDEGDGVVELQSARAADAVSEIEVQAEHSRIHQHPRAILEVRRILLEHLVELNRVSNPGTLVIPVNFEQPPSGSAADFRHADGEQPSTTDPVR